MTSGKRTIGAKAGKGRAMARKFSVIFAVILAVFTVSPKPGYAQGRGGWHGGGWQGCGWGWRAGWGRGPGWGWGRPVAAGGWGSGWVWVPGWGWVWR